VNYDPCLKTRNLCIPDPIRDIDCDGDYRKKWFPRCLEDRVLSSSRRQAFTYPGDPMRVSWLKGERAGLLDLANRARAVIAGKESDVALIGYAQKIVE